MSQTWMFIKYTYSLYLRCIIIMLSTDYHEGNLKIPKGYSENLNSKNRPHSNDKRLSTMNPQKQGWGVVRCPVRVSVSTSDIHPVVLLNDNNINWYGNRVRHTKNRNSLQNQWGVKTNRTSLQRGYRSGHHNINRHEHHKKTGVERVCTERVSGTCSTTCIHDVTLINNPAIRHERWNGDGIETTTNGTYPWSSVRDTDIS
jgi:hypothetical protein